MPDTRNQRELTLEENTSEARPPEARTLKLAMVEVEQGVARGARSTSSASAVDGLPAGDGEAPRTLLVPKGTECMGQLAAGGRMWREFEDFAFWPEAAEAETGDSETESSEAESSEAVAGEAAAGEEPSRPAPPTERPAPRVEVTVRSRCGVCGEEVIAGTHLAEARPRKADIKPSTTTLAGAGEALTRGRRPKGGSPGGHGWRRSSAFGWVCHREECHERIPADDGQVSLAMASQAEDGAAGFEGGYFGLAEGGSLAGGSVAGAALENR